jgi:predicted ATPase
VARNSASPYFLPASLTRIFGRDHETHTLLQMLANPKIRLITITGAPGVGKTSLALHVAHQAQFAFADGAIFADLIPVRYSDFVMNSIAVTLSKNKATTQDLQSALQDKNLLMVIDNFEHVLEAAPSLIPILEYVPNLKIIVTSREPLHIRGEQEFPLLPLPLPSQFEKESPALDLFIERARAIQPSFKLDEKTASDVAQICYRLDGLPLAIEIAAAQTRSMNPAAILQKLGDRYGWQRHEQNIPKQQKTLQNAIEWSYALLSEAEQNLFNRLSIFAGGWTFEAAKSICSDKAICRSSEIFNLLNQLVGKSLIVFDSVQSRYTFLETLRVFAKNELTKTDEFEKLGQRHAEYYLNFFRKIKLDLTENIIDDFTWMVLNRAEHPNLRVALNWAMTPLGDVALASDLVRETAQFLMLSGNLTEARKWLDKILALENINQKTKVILYHIASDYAGKQGENEIGRKYQELGLEVAKTINDLDMINLSVEGMARAEYREGNFLLAIDIFEEALAHKRIRPNKIGVIRTLNYLAMSNREAGRLDRALELGLESIEICRHISALPDLEHALIVVGEVYVKRKEFTRALPYQTESLTIAHQLGFLHGIATGLSFLAFSLHNLGKSTLATQMEGTSHKIRHEIGIALSTPASVEKSQKLH